MIHKNISKFHSSLEKKHVYNRNALKINLKILRKVVRTRAKKKWANGMHPFSRAAFNLIIILYKDLAVKVLLDSDSPISLS